ncbi:hypothetical protein [Haloferax volcanii]|nr:hypothetical protein [Haloferax alexandrinus]
MTDVLTIAAGVALGVIVAAPVASLLTAFGWAVLDELMFGR